MKTECTDEELVRRIQDLEIRNKRISADIRQLEKEAHGHEQEMDDLKHVLRLRTTYSEIPMPRLRYCAEC